MPLDLVRLLQIQRARLSLHVDDVRIRIPAVPDQVAPARHWLSALLSGGHESVADDIVLMAWEAVTNSICHSDSGVAGADGEPGTVTLVVLDAGDAMRVEVTDAGSPDSVPQVTDDGPDSLHGRGLHLLDVLSAGRWGSYADGDGRTVWFEVAIDRRGSPDPGAP